MRARSNLCPAFALAMVLPLAGCADYLNHRDTITLGAGDATTANRAIQTIDPWPPASRETEIRSDGRIIKRAVDQYGQPPPPAKDAAKPATTATP